MSWISAYRRYPQPEWYYRQTRPAKGRQPRPQPARAPERPAPQPERVAPPPSDRGGPPPRAKAGKPGLAGMLSSFLPEGLDAGDIFLAAMLLFLYSESGDEDFLIILIVVGLSIFKKDGGGD